jgi:phytoene synthase
VETLSPPDGPQGRGHVEPSRLGLDDQVRRADPDRWLASRFITDAQARADVIALYALNHELARVAETVREPLMGEIRLTWWREALDEIFAGGAVRRHPVTDALAPAIRRRGLARAPLEAMVEARFADLEPDALAKDGALEAYADGTAGALMALAVAVCGGVEAHGLRRVAWAWSLAGLLRLRQAGVARLPAQWDEARVRAAVRGALGEARPAVQALPVAAFPGIAYATLAGPYAAGRTPSELEKRLRLTFAVLTGRL